MSITSRNNEGVQKDQSQKKNKGPRYPTMVCKKNHVAHQRCYKQQPRLYSNDVDKNKGLFTAPLPDPKFLKPSIGFNPLSITPQMASQYTELFVEGVVGSSNGLLSVNGSTVGIVRGTNVGRERVSLFALLVCLDDPLITDAGPEPLPEPPADSGGFGNAKDSEGEKGRTDMGVSTSESGFVVIMTY